EAGEARAAPPSGRLGGAGEQDAPAQAGLLGHRAGGGGGGGGGGGVSGGGGAGAGGPWGGPPGGPGPGGRHAAWVALRNDGGVIPRGQTLRCGVVASNVPSGSGTSW